MVFEPITYIYIACGCACLAGSLTYCATNWDDPPDWWPNFLQPWWNKSDNDLTFDTLNQKGSTLYDGSILVSAKMDCKDFNKKFDKIIPKGEYETIVGYIISTLGRIPNKGEHLFMPIGQIIIEEATARQVNQIKIYPKETNSSE